MCTGSEEAGSTEFGRPHPRTGELQDPVTSSAEAADPVVNPSDRVRSRAARSEESLDPARARGGPATSSGAAHGPGGADSEGKQSSVEGEPTPVVKESLMAAQGPAKRKVPMLCQVGLCFGRMV